MLNILRSDFYRIRHSKSIWVIIAAFVALIVFIYASTALSSANQLTGDGSEEAPAAATGGISAPFLFLPQANILMYFILALVYTVVIGDFSSGATKNSLAAGVSRTTLYFARLLEGILLTVLLFALGVIIAVAIYTMAQGFGGTFTLDWLLSVLRPFAAQCVMLAGAVAIGTAIGFISKRGAVVIGLYLALYLSCSIVLYLLATNIADWIIAFDFDANLERLASIDTQPLEDTLRGLGLGVGCIAISTALGLAIFKKSEVK
jgi:ABC-type transport system involved in multi-copper enzyme maturation permease subunit